MKALTLTQPWASLVAIGAKRVETRSWGTSHRGWLAIHAAKGFPEDARMECIGGPIQRALVLRGLDESNLPRGAVVAVGCLVGVFRVQTFATLKRQVSELFRFDLANDEEAFGNYEAGRYAWILDGVREEHPCPVRGSLGLWEWNEEVSNGAH